MGKRSNFKRMKNDLYPTPYKAVLPLLRHLQSQTRYIEPCVGNGDLCNHLTMFGHDCVGAYDLPDDVTTTEYDCRNAECSITNPPWSRDILHSAINNLRIQRPTWLLFDAGWAFTKQAVEYLPYCRKIVAVGRVKWIPDSPHTGKDDAAWYLFVHDRGNTQFIGNL